MLVLEKLSTPQARVSYLESRRNLRSRPQINNYNTRKLQKKRKGDLKAEEEIAGIDMNDYDLTSLQIPYGPNWTAKRIEKIVYGTDLGINCEYDSTSTITIVLEAFNYEQLSIQRTKVDDSIDIPHSSVLWKNVLRICAVSALSQRMTMRERYRKRKTRVSSGGAFRQYPSFFSSPTWSINALYN